MEDKWMNKIEKEKKNSMQFPCASKYENQEKLKIIKNTVFYKYDKE